MPATAVTPTASHRKDYSMTPATEGMPTTLLASAGTPTEYSCQKQYGSQSMISLRGNSRKTRQNGEKFVKKTIKRAIIVRFMS
jgi:hypothetical protein